MKMLIATALLATPLLLLQDAEAPAPKGPEIGAPAPSFRLNDQDGAVVEVGGEADHWSVLAFYPKAMTGG